MHMEYSLHFSQDKRHELTGENYMESVFFIHKHREGILPRINTDTDPKNPACYASARSVIFLTEPIGLTTGNYGPPS